MGKTITLEIPAPADWINANHRHHHHTKARLTRSWRDATAWAAKQHRLPVLTPPVRIVAHIYKPRGGRYDPNNWSPTTKACVDGLVDAGVLPDDDHTNVIGPDHRHGGKDQPKLVLTITEQGDQP